MGYPVIFAGGLNAAQPHQVLLEVGRMNVACTAATKRHTDKTSFKTIACLCMQLGQECKGSRVIKKNMVLANKAGSSFMMLLESPEVGL